MPGWLVEEEVVYTDDVEIDSDATPAPDDRHRRVVAAALEGTMVIPVEGFVDFWLLLAPDQAEPTAQEAAEEHARREAEESR